jgi:hypothetical protein
MPATRTQVYLTPEQRQRIDEVARSRGVTLAEVVRRALDDYLDEEAPNPAPILAETFGAAPDIAPPDRDEWDRG